MTEKDLLYLFKDTRANRGDSMASVARFVGCSAPTLKRYEDGGGCGWYTQGNINHRGPITYCIKQYVEMAREEPQTLDRALHGTTNTAASE